MMWSILLLVLLLVLVQQVQVRVLCVDPSSSSTTTAWSLSALHASRATTRPRLPHLVSNDTTRPPWWKKLYNQHIEPVTLTLCLGKPSPVFIQDRMHRFSQRAFNHYSSSEAVLTTTFPNNNNNNNNSNNKNGYAKKSIRTHLGQGEDIFHRAKALVLTGQLSNAIPWCRLVRSSSSSSSSTAMCKGDTVATLIQFHKLPLWSLNPCRVVEVVCEDNQRALVRYSTLQGHLLQGEECFQVAMSPRGAVRFEMSTYSTGSNLWSKCCLPLIRPLQDKFLRAHVDALHTLLSTPHVVAK